MTTETTSSTWPCLAPNQTRDHEPTAYELKLARTLEEIFTHVGHELADVVAPARTAAGPADGATASGCFTLR